MENLTPEDLQKTYQEIIFLIGFKNICFVFFVNQRIQYIKKSIHEVEQCMKEFHFVGVDYQTLINTLHYVRNGEKKQEIQLKNGIVLKVSRRKWELFQEK